MLRSVRTLGFQPLRRFAASRSMSDYPVGEKPFDKILIANRGEIACRVMRTAKKLGVKTVAVYSDADASAMHVKMADEAHWIGGPRSQDSYLQMERILEVCKKTGAQAIHPGYGFLSENAKFVNMVEEAGLKFIGPSSKPMDLMGDKIHSKKVAKDAKCFVIPGFEGEIENADEAVKRANEVGYPVMIKASAGGGGKGMRVAFNDEEAREGFALSKSEAMSSFGDDRMLIERFIENPHHIEIQVLADTHGNVVAFPERECSVQRRNQKVVEESPSCLLTHETRRLMQEQSIALCKAVDYRSAGTIEMLADDKQNFYFLEMNTRLQVEHPITEMVSGEDLVEHMLWIAADKPLPKRLTDKRCLDARGSAIECRIYAEDPLRNFLPSIGPLIQYKEPQQYGGLIGGGVVGDGGTVRIDTGVFEGGTVSMYYDAMISKLCTHAPTRKESVAIMEDALDNYMINGLTNNIAFCRDVMRNKVFRTGHYSTKFIEEQYPDGFQGVQLNKDEHNQLLVIAAAMHSARSENNGDVHRAKGSAAPIIDHSFSSTKVGGAAAGGEFADADFDPEEMGGMREEHYVVLTEGPKGNAHDVILTSDGYHLKASIAKINKKGEVSEHRSELILSELSWRNERPLARVTFQLDNEKEEELTRVVQYFGRNHSGEGYKLMYNGSQQEVIVRSVKEHEADKYMLAPEVKDFSKFLLCPMPGTLLSIDVKDGQHVEIGQQLAVVEAMKMQNSLRAEKAGIVKSVLKVAGTNLKVDETIIEFE